MTSIVDFWPQPETFFHYQAYYLKTTLDIKLNSPVTVIKCKCGGLRLGLVDIGHADRMQLQNIEHQVLEKLPIKTNGLQHKFSANDDVIFLNAEHAMVFNQDRCKLDIQELTKTEYCRIIIRVLGVKITKEGTASLVARIQQLLIDEKDSNDEICLFD